jgi:phosphatidylserine/phosphatidylglycerophosphate/cardiolipin synthase-like enzyme
MTHYVTRAWVVVSFLLAACSGGEAPIRPDRPNAPPVEIGGGKAGKADGFDWGSGCEGGSGTFNQAIAHNAVVTVGTIPAEMTNVEITLTSDKDVDIQLFDEDGTAVVQWPDGLLNGAEEQSTSYKGVTVTWSGYNGDGTNLGHEYIKLEGVTSNAFVMKAYGYASGQARIDYKWDAKPDCVDSGSGTFTQSIPHNAVVEVGKIRSGLSDVKIQLISPVDIDIQLYDSDETAVVKWPDGLLDGPDEQSTSYKGVTVVWSGYNGDGTGPGNETIELRGTTQTELTMKVFGYQAGTATVNYSWGAQTDAQASVIFSPTSTSKSHVAEAVKLIKAAKTSVDIAMYSMSDKRVNDALQEAVQRGVKVRFIYHQAQEDRKSPAGTASAKLEEQGIDIRYATKSKVMHHKFMIVDGPRKDDQGNVDLSLADSATLVTGSGNWSYGAQSIYDENTVFLKGVPALVLAFQEEFNRMWNYSHDFVWKTFAYEKAATLDHDSFPADANADALFTSANFKKNLSFTVISGSYAVGKAVVAELNKATQSIQIASGHMRSWPVYDALIKLMQQNPNLKIQVYLDGQEYISQYYDAQLQQDLQTCLTAAAGDAAKELECRLGGLYFSYQLHKAQVPLRFKYYCYRWDYHYAKQMHHKYIIIDGKTLLTGSYNLSDNAERNTLENVVVLRGATYAALVKEFEANFKSLWNTDSDGSLLGGLQQKVANDATIPLVFAPMALTWDQVTALKNLIETNCPAVSSAEYKDNPQDHTTCPRAP